MTSPIHIAGDGVAGLMLAATLSQRGAEVVVHGDGAARGGSYALVHRHAGRSFRTNSLDDQIWHAACAGLERFVDSGAVVRTRMARPLSSRAGARLGRSVRLAPAVTREHIAPFGECFVYEPAYVVDIAAALGTLAEDLDLRMARTERADAIFAVGADLAADVVDRYGGHLVEFEGSVPLAVAGGGLHAVPTPRGVCVGSTWWDVAEPMSDDAAIAQLRDRATGLGLDLGAALRVWCGVRAVNRIDRRPIIGWLGGRFVVGALGTRGWYWMPFVASHVAHALLDGTPIRPELAAQRLLQT